MKDTMSPFTFSRSSRASEEHAERNEDRTIADAAHGLAAVFDGVGGVTGGEIAARIAAQTIRSGWKRLVRHRNDDIIPLLQSLVQTAHERVRRDGTLELKVRYNELTEPIAPKTTLALVAVYEKDGAPGYSVVYAWIGDSRVYALPAEGQLIRLTVDDGLLTELVSAHLLAQESARRIDQATEPWQLNRTERIYFEKRNGITQALGDRFLPTLHIEQTSIAPGDRFLLCTDGIHDNLTDEELEALLRRGARTTVARHIVEAAALRSRNEPSEVMRAKPDDMSAIVITCHASPPPAARSG